MCSWNVMAMVQVGNILNALFEMRRYSGIIIIDGMSPRWDWLSEIRKDVARHVISIEQNHALTNECVTSGHNHNTFTIEYNEGVVKEFYSENKYRIKKMELLIFKAKIVKERERIHIGPHGIVIRKVRVEVSVYLKPNTTW